MDGASPKAEMVRRLDFLVKGLKRGKHDEAAEDLAAAVRSLKTTIPADASIQEVVTRSLSTIIRREITLDGKLVSTLAHVAHEVGVKLADNPALLISVVLASDENPDRETHSDSVDAVASCLMEDCVGSSYEDVVEVAHKLSEMAGLPATSAELADLQAEINGARVEDQAKTREQRLREQAATIEESAGRKPSDTGDWGWAVKVMLTLLALLAAAGALLEALEDPIGAARRLLDDP